MIDLVCQQKLRNSDKTQFTVAHESVYPDFRKALVLETSDGGTTTLKHVDFPPTPVSRALGRYDC